MMKFMQLLWLFLLLSFGVTAQDSAWVQWNVKCKKISEKTYELRLQGKIAAGKFLYLFSKESGLVDTISVRFNDSAIIPKGAIAFKGTLTSYKDPLFEQQEMTIVQSEVELIRQITFSETVPLQLAGTIVYTAGSSTDFLPSQESEFVVALDGGTSEAGRIKISSIDIRQPVKTCGDEGTEGKSLWGIFLLGLAGGFIALLTPCVFPLIPLTVSFFTKRSGSKVNGIRNASLYGLFIFLIYVFLSVPFHLLDHTDPEILNNISTNVWLNLLFFVIFIFFAFSFFGFYEISLPGSFASGVDAKANTGGLTGIFFMALTLAIVSFSCTGPILGSLLAGALTKDGGALQLTFGMGGFGLGIALPFALFALFPNWLHSLPKSGGWLNTVKVVLGFLELAMAIKFFSNADLVQQWNLLPRELFIGIWIVIGVLIVSYLLNLIHFPHDDRNTRIGPVRVGFILLFAAATFYLTPGVTNTKSANLTLISGFPPPLCYSVYQHPIHCERTFEPLRDYEKALEQSKREKKPLLIDFTGWACVNCRRMEENVWTDPEVLELMKNRFVVVSLYVDERSVLPAAKQQVITTKSGAKKSIVTVGDQWSAFQSENFNAVAQPQYAIIGGNEVALTKTKSYTPNPKEFAEWLRCGLEAYREQQ
jgi:thiol:disulfide interchange protein DsbD